MMKSRSIALIVALAAMLARAPVVGDEPKDGIDAEGYVCTWLVLAPVPLKEGQEGANALDEESVTGEANVKPEAGDKLDVDGKNVTWKECRTKDQILDFNGLLGKETERSVGYAVAYITADSDVADLTLKLGSDDQVKVYLNGKAIHSHDEERSFEKDEDSVPDLSLKKGLNVLVVKVVNEESDWLLSARLVDKDGKPAGGLKATTKRE
jgi:hypothetical protein